MSFGVGFVLGGLLAGLMLTHAEQTKKLLLTAEGAASRGIARAWRAVRAKF